MFHSPAKSLVIGFVAGISVLCLWIAVLEFPVRFSSVQTSVSENQTFKDTECDFGENNPLAFDIIVHQAGPNELPSVLSFQTLKTPLHCKYLFLHVVSPGYLDKMEIWIRRQTEWISHFPDDCFFSFVNRNPLPLYNEPTAIGATYKQVVDLVRFRNRYDVQAMLASAYLQGFLLDREGSGPLGPLTASFEAPWIFFTDVDVLQLNKKKSIADVVARVTRGMSIPTAEERLCQEGETFFCSPPKVNSTRPDSVGDIAYVLPLDLICYDSWMYNAGAVLWRPSRLLGFMGQSVLWTLNDTSQSHRFDNSDQARIGLLLRETFDLHPDLIRFLCGAPFNDNFWKPSSNGDEILFLRRFNLDKALRHRLYQTIGVHWFAEARLWPTEPDTVAIVNPRWFDSGACDIVDKMDPRRVDALFMQCGDFNIHFNGCLKDQYYSKTFRQKAAASPTCVDLLPWKTNDENTGPFNAEDWISSSMDVQPGQKLQEPRGRLRYGE
eukprot:Protomagalhaensia_sp_Gyna_25__5296@NODE_65_length_5715_cov_10_441860_g48_i0_p1_GENE_NODE_65_length_5715_cov_10_441860_g48_i0NODE_65_length_5715_cov_10_441860_g48_i0_p1_ORF_typecomplete_len494_score69_56_NODE_65_length_5715_cov_10_441860_g48_i013872868